MKRPGLILPTLAATLFLLLASGTIEGAQETTKADTAAAKAARKADELLKRFDQNRDGRLDDDERANAKDAMMQEQLDRQMARVNAGPGGSERFRAQALALFDANKDGRLDDDERAEAQKFAEARQDPLSARDDLTKRFDRNQDGRLDADERSQAEAFLVELRAYGASRMRDGLLRQFDRNVDGKLDDQEMTALEQAMRPRMESTPLQRRRYDADGNQKIDDAEWAVARAKIAAWLNGTGPAALENEPPRSGGKAKR